MIYTRKEAPSPFKEAGYKEVQFEQGKDYVDLTPNGPYATYISLYRYNLSISKGRIIPNADNANKINKQLKFV